MESDKGDEETDASGNGGIELMGDAAQDELADTESGEQQEGDAGDEDSAERISSLNIVNVMSWRL